MEKVIKPDEKFHGRLKTRRLSARQKNLFETLMPKVGIKSYKDADIANFHRVFLEIGFGGGEHLAQVAMDNPNDLFIGCEPFVNGVASLLGKIDDNKIENIRIYQADARGLIKEIPNDTLSGVFLLFPDPWSKKRHTKRRFLQDKTIADIYTRLVVGGFWRLASDHEVYKAWILELFGQEKFKDLFTVRTYTKENRPDTSIWAKTRYEMKATNDILYIECVKNRGIDEIGEKA